MLVRLFIPTYIGHLLDTRPRSLIALAGGLGVNCGAHGPRSELGDPVGTWPAEAVTQALLPDDRSGPSPWVPQGQERGAVGRSVVVGDQDYKTETVANADDIADADGVAILSFAQAQGVAREMRARAARIAAGMPIEAGPFTVKQCMAEYLTWMEQNRKGAKDARYRAEALIIPKLGATECEKLRAGELRGWLQQVANTPARIRGKKGSGPRFRNVDEKDKDTVRRRRASANRTLTILKAGLNMAWREGKIGSDDAWRRVTPFEEADAARVRYLQIDEAQRLINASEPEFRGLVRAALATGARYSELANLRVGDFNPDAGTVHVRASKSGKGRHIVLTEEGPGSLEAYVPVGPRQNGSLSNRVAASG
jgi:hypothetical protein